MGKGDRKAIRLNRAGGSKTAILPATWLDGVGIRGDDAVLVWTDAGILVAPPTAGEASVEDEPAFANFLSFLAQDALLHPERLGDVGDLVAGDDELLEGVEPAED